MLRSLRPLARRSALTATLIARLGPLAAADHARVREAAALRGPAAAPVGRASMVSRLVAGSLDRAVDAAAALELRGYAGMRRARAPPAALAGTPGDWLRRCGTWGVGPSCARRRGRHLRVVPRDHETGAATIGLALGAGAPAARADPAPGPGRYGDD